MSFEFPKLKSKTTSSSSNDDNEDFDLLTNPEPDYDELLIRLSLFAFNQLSPNDQQQKIEEISHLVKPKDVKIPEESDAATKVATFEALLVQLPFADQLEFFPFEALHVKLSYADQLKVFLSNFLDKIKPTNQVPTSSNNKLSRWNIGSSSSSSSSIQDFFNGFSTIWFEGQSALGQEMLLKQLEKGISKGVVGIPKRREEETEEGFKLRRFKELSMSCVVDFRVQLKFLKNAEWKLQYWGEDRDHRLIVEPQDFDTASQFLTSLWSFGVSLMSAEYQEEKIDEMTAELQRGTFYQEEKIDEMTAELQRVVHHDSPRSVGSAKSTGCRGKQRIPTKEEDQSEESMRIKSSTDLFDQVPVSSRIKLFKGLRTSLVLHLRYSKAVQVFKGIHSKAQMRIIEYMLNCLYDPKSYMVEKISDESEEDFRLRRFTKLCFAHISTMEDILWPYNMQLETTSADEYHTYDEFMSGLTMMWYKAKCTKMRRNPIQLILFEQVEISDTIQKLPEESEEDYRLRRFAELFTQLDLASKNSVVDYIQDALFGDLGELKKNSDLDDQFDADFIFNSSYFEMPTTEGRGDFDPDWINYIPTNPRNLVAATSQLSSKMGDS